MKIIFYSEKCIYSSKLLKYINNNNINHLFKIINIDNNKYPKEITVVPSIIDTNLNQILKGEQVFNYIKNIKYFNNSTNNIYNLVNINNPDIKEDDKALNKDEFYVTI